MIPIDQKDVMPKPAHNALRDHFGQPLIWRLLATEGTRHKLYHATLESQHWIARVEPEIQAAPGVDPWREKTILLRLQSQRWAIAADLIDPDIGLLLMPFGGEPKGRDQLRASEVDEICRVVAEMHRICDVPLLNYPALFEHYRQAFNRSQPGLSQLVSETERLLVALPDIGECLVHHDLHSGNMLWGDHLTLIDWEYSGLGNPWLDYATLERDIGLSLKQLQSFDRLKGFTAEEIEHWLASAIQVVDQLENMWQHYNQLHTNPSQTI